MFVCVHVSLFVSVCTPPRATKFDSVSSLLATGTGTGMGASKKAAPVGFSLDPDFTAPVKPPAKTKKKARKSKTVPVAVSAAPENVTMQGPPPVHFPDPGGFEIGVWQCVCGCVCVRVWLCVRVAPSGVESSLLSCVLFSIIVSVHLLCVYVCVFPTADLGSPGATALFGSTGGSAGDTVDKRVREVCFNCWSRGLGAKCEMHLPPGERDRPVPPGQSVLVCTNWDIAAIARKYRSEEIQEVRPACVCARVCVTVCVAVIVRSYFQLGV